MHPGQFASFGAEGIVKSLVKQTKELNKALTSMQEMFHVHSTLRDPRVQQSGYEVQIGAMWRFVLLCDFWW